MPTVPQRDRLMDGQTDGQMTYNGTNTTCVAR